ncbi:matrixin family metalloprotease [Halorientalis brevis]|uniref:Matrixin family metalloprotease n=1 Tax=Halorientalis brevis TaxID=1126241 RepID=A0ABD6CB34_9EURY|nr:matrixin family metalloprotease [Halorientalis brevis]
MKRALVLVSLLLLAGCSAIPGTQTETPNVETTHPVETTDSTPLDPSTTASAATATSDQTTPTPTAESAQSAATPTPELNVEPADNPWGKDTVTVALVAGGHDEIDYRSALSGALDYWNAHAEFGDYTVEYVLVDDADDADVRVKIRESVETCGVEQSEQVLGCAPLLTEGTRADPPTTVTIEAGYNHQSTEDVMIHEFGHVLGIRHGEEPQAYMQPKNTAYLTAQPNASERGYPWQTTEFRFHVATEDSQRDREAVRDQVGHVIDYFDRIKDEDPAVPSNVSVSWADNRSDANVVVQFRERLPDGGTGGSTVQQYGFDPDGDQAIEYYANVTVTVAAVDTETVGWHTGYWFGQVLGIDEDNLPDPLRSADARDRRDDWWTDSP